MLKPALKQARRPGRYIVLSLFDGVGAAVAILENLFGTPTAAMAWETDRTCRRLTSHRLPWLQQRGDFGSETVEKVTAEIRRLDPAGECVVLMIAAPPCQDFSRIGAETGHSGTRGGLFLRSAEFVLELRAALRGWRVGFMFENVVMQPAAAKEVSDCLGVEPILVCASDFGWISRPRLWWISGDLRRPHWRGPKRGPSITSGWKRPGRRRARCYPRAWLSIRRSPPAGCCYPVPLRRRRMRTAARRPRGPGGKSRSRRGLDGWRTAGSSPPGTTPRRRCCTTRRAGSTTSPPALRRPSTRSRRATLTWETATSARGTGWWPMVGTGGWRGASSPCSWHSRWRSRPQDHHGVVDGGPVRRRTPGHDPPTPPGVPAGPPRG